MGGFIKQVFATIFAILLLCVGGVFGLALIGAGKSKTVIPEHSTIRLTMPVELTEYPPTRGRPFGERPLTLHDVRISLKKAAVDKRVDRVLFELGFGDMGWASIDEMRREIAATRKAGKPVYAYCNWLTLKNLYLASACDSIWLAPDAFVVLNGINAEREFHKGLWDKLGVQFRVHKIEKYKAAGEIDIRTDMSPEARQNAQWILDATVAYVKKAIIADRKKDEAWWDGVIASAAMRATEARERGLADRVCYLNDFIDQWEGENKDRIVTGTKYWGVKPIDVGIKGKTKIAIIHAQGAIAGAKSGDNPFLGGTTMGYDTINREIRKVAADSTVDAVVFRVDSPGGDTFASDLIRQQVERMAQTKKVVVSMGDVAGSGGYMIAYCAPTIMANSMTRTGSIGSIFSLPNAKGLMDKIGFSYDRVTYGPHATMTSIVAPWTAQEESIVVKTHWASYYEWVDDVAEKRGTTRAGIDSLGRGRVWTGDQAVANGLIDKVGTLDDAIALAASQAGGKADDVNEVHYPKLQTFWDAVAAGDFDLARAILAQSMVKDAAEPVDNAWQSARAWLMSPELAVMEDPDR